MPTPPDPVAGPGLRRSVATVCLSGTLEDKLAAAAAAGFDGVEMFENDLVTSSSSPADVAHAPPTWAWRSTSTSRSATSRRCRTRSSATTSAAPSASST